MVPRIKIEAPGNPNYRYYHTTVEISGSMNETFYRPLRPSSVDYLNKVGEIGAQLVEEFLSTLGVVEVRVTPYCLSVQKGGAFRWNEIDPPLIQILQRVLGAQLEEPGPVAVERTESSLVPPHKVVTSRGDPAPAETEAETPREGFWKRFWKGFSDLFPEWSGI